MTGEDATIAVIDALNSLNAPYMLVGSLSTNFYGIPRSTQDADIVVEMSELSLPALTKALGPDFRVDPQMSFEMVTGTSRHVVAVRDHSFKIELFHLSDDDHDRVRFGRRRRVSILGRDAFLPAPEDVIVTKLRWLLRGERKKDADDVRNVLTVQRTTLDFDYIRLWCDRHGTRDLFEDSLRAVPVI